MTEFQFEICELNADQTVKTQSVRLTGARDHGWKIVSNERCYEMIQTMNDLCVRTVDMDVRNRLERESESKAQRMLDPESIDPNRN